MCGIAGRILNSPGKIGRDLVELMDAQEHRGADSTGFAIYGVPRETGFVVRIMGFDRKTIDQDIEEFLTILRTHSGNIFEDPTCDSGSSKHYSLRVEITKLSDLETWTRDIDANSARWEIQSVGKPLEIIKDTDGAYFCTQNEADRLPKVIFTDKNTINPENVGLSPYRLTELADISLPPKIRCLVSDESEIGWERQLSAEKLNPVLAFYEAKDSKIGIGLAKKIIKFGGWGYTAVQHCDDANIVNYLLVG